MIGLIIENDEGVAVFNPVLRTISPYKDAIAESRKGGKNYEIANRISTEKMAFIYLVCNPGSNVFARYPDSLEDRISSAKDRFVEEWELNDTMKECIEDYSKMVAEMPSYRLIKAAQIAIGQAADRLLGIDWTKTNTKTGQPIHDPGTVLEWTSKVEEQTRHLKNVEKRFLQEGKLVEEKLRGKGTKHNREDPKRR